MNLGFNFDDSYAQSTSKFDREPLDHNISDDGEDFTKDELKKLLACLEVDLQAKENTISRLKAERAKFLLHEAKYGKLCANDPFLALRRDSTITEEVLDERQIGQLYESQLVQLEKLIATQRKSFNKAKSLLAAAEKRHAKALQELELEKERKSRYAEQGDDVLALLEKERNKLANQVEHQMSLVSDCKKENGKLEKKLLEEKEKHKAMVLFLMNERKQLLLKMHELKMKNEKGATNPPAGSSAAQDVLIQELRKEVLFLRQERDSLKSDNKSLKAENLSLKEVVKGQENDLALLRRNILSNTKFNTDKTSPPGTMLPQLSDESAFVVANRMATGAPRTRLANSSSFPTERSRLPRAPSSPARTPASTTSQTVPRTPSSPTKKMPAMGLGTVRQRAAAGMSSSSALTASASSSGVPSAEPELKALESAINSMNVKDGPNVAPSSPTKRSSSLPRGRSEPRPTNGNGTIPVYKTEPRMTPQMGSRIVPPTRQEPPSRKLSGTVKRNGLSALTKAFAK